MKENRLCSAKKISILQARIPVRFATKWCMLSRWNSFISAFRSFHLTNLVNRWSTGNRVRSGDQAVHYVVPDENSERSFFIPIIKKTPAPALGRYPKQNDPTIRASCRIWPFSCFVRLASAWETFLLRSEKSKTNTVLLTFVIPYNIIFSRCNRLWNVKISLASPLRF